LYRRSWPPARWCMRASSNRPWLASPSRHGALWWRWTEVVARGRNDLWGQAGAVLLEETFREISFAHVSCAAEAKGTGPRKYTFEDRCMASGMGHSSGQSLSTKGGQCRPPNGGEGPCKRLAMIARAVCVLAVGWGSPTAVRDPRTLAAESRVCMLQLSIKDSWRSARSGILAWVLCMAPASWRLLIRPQKGVRCLLERLTSPTRTPSRSISSTCVSRFTCSSGILRKCPPRPSCYYAECEYCVGRRRALPHWGSDFRALSGSQWPASTSCCRVPWSSRGIRCPVSNPN